jgi:hypothetical protein
LVSAALGRGGERHVHSPAVLVFGEWR